MRLPKENGTATITPEIQAQILTAPASFVFPGSRDPMTHNLKMLPVYFKSAETYAKRFEIRKADRAFMLGDTLHLTEWDDQKRGYTGRSLDRKITHLSIDSPGLMPGYILLSVEPISADQPTGDDAAVELSLPEIAERACYWEAEADRHKAEVADLRAKLAATKTCYEAQIEKEQEDAAHWKQEYDGAMVKP